MASKKKVVTPATRVYRLNERCDDWHIECTASNVTTIVFTKNGKEIESVPLNLIIDAYLQTAKVEAHFFGSE